MFGLNGNMRTFIYDLRKLLENIRGFLEFSHRLSKIFSTEITTIKWI